MNKSIIEEHIRELLSSLPPGVLLVAAAKTRTAEEVQVAIKAGVKILGYNYVQEAEQIFRIIGRQVSWHMIGHLQRNKVRRAAILFDMIESLDSIALARALSGICVEMGKVMPVLVEVNSGREPNKTGILPESVVDFVRAVSILPNLSVQGLMTMAPITRDPELVRPYLRETRSIFDRIAGLAIENIEMRYLSMGMSDTYKIAIEEGANMIRIGTRLFGPRNEH